VPPDEASPGERTISREEIVRSARRVIAQEGWEKFTLSAVARDADVPRNSVYGMFRNKTELLLAIAAGDLSALARTMHGDSSPRPVPLPHGEFVTALAESAGPKLSADTIVPDTLATAAAAMEPAAIPPLIAPHEEAVCAQTGDIVEELPSMARRRGEASQLHEIIHRLTVPNPQLGEGSAAAVTRVDRRMSVVERALADLEARFDKFERVANDGRQTTETSLEGLVQRAERTDQRIAQTATTLRGELLAAFTRIDPPKTEPPRVTPPPDENDSAVAASDTATSDIAPDDTASVAPEEAAPENDASPQPEHRSANDDYLSNARRRASEAAIAQQAAAAPARKRRRRRHLLRRNELFGIGAISVVVILATMGIALSEGFIGAKPHPAASTAAPVAQPAAAPQQHIARAATAPAVTPEPAAKPEPAPPQHHLSPLERAEALANGGNAKAAVIVGVKYLDGDGVLRNDAVAAHWLERAAKAGEPVAQYRLGTLYQRGAGVVKDETKALHWYEAAANQGNRKAMHNLGVFYAEGRGTVQDYDKAASWFLRAANMGYLDSQFDLAVLYERGAGVPQNLGDAYKWYDIAAREGDDISKARIEVLETQLDPPELAAARTAAHAFHAAPMSRIANMTPLLADLRAK
jgi:TPR repeat protein